MVGTLGIAAFLAHFATLVISRDKLWITLDDFVQVCFRPRQVARAVAQQGAVVEGKVVVRLQGDALVEIFDGTVQIAHFGADKAPVVIGAGRLGIELKYPVEIAENAFVVAVVIAGQPTVAVIALIVGLQADGFVQVADGIGEFVLQDKHIGSGGIGRRVIFVNGDGAAEIIDGTQGVAFFYAEMSAVHVAVEIVGKLACQVVEVLAGTFVVFGIDMRRRFVDHQGFVLGVEFQTLVAVGNGSLIIFQLQAGVAAAIVSLDHKRIAFQG